MIHVPELFQPLNTSALRRGLAEGGVTLAAEFAFAK